MSNTSEITRIIDTMPPLPEVAYRVLQIVNDPEFSTDALVAVIRTDSTLTERILSLCNSNLFGLPRQITSVSDAVAYIGIRSLVKLVLVACTASYYRNVDAGYSLRTGEIWKHSIACAIGCELMAERFGFEDTGAAYTAGILHNVGKVALSQVLANEASAIREALEDESLDFLEVERMVVGMDHAKAGGIITEQWYLPVDLRRSIKNHHDPQQVLDDSELTALVHVADILAIQLGIGTGIDGLNYPLCSEALRKICTTGPDLDKIRIQIVDELNRSAELVNLR